MDNKNIVDMRNARTEEYRRVLENIQQDGQCPFCFENFEKYSHSKHVPIQETADWFLVQNSWPYANTKYHFLIIPKRHCKDFHDIIVSDMMQVQEIVGYAKEAFSIIGGGIMLRFGDTTHTGATVAHLHFHLIVPELDTVTGKAKTVYFPIG